MKGTKSRLKRLQNAHHFESGKIDENQDGGKLTADQLPAEGASWDTYPKIHQEGRFDQSFLLHILL